MFGKRGFTLIELLVVIAIITILASIVAPRVQNWLERARMAKAVSEIRNADLTITKMLMDADRKHVGQMISWGNPTAGYLNPSALTYQQAVDMYTGIFYELLRRGKNAELSTVNPLLSLNRKAKEKLGTSYMDLGTDPWGIAYQFYAGPLKAARGIYFRSYRDGIQSIHGEGCYVYTDLTRIEENRVMLGNPPQDDYAGYPCPLDLQVYIWSYGGDSVNNQPAAAYVNIGDARGDCQYNGNDDINNWDNATGWSRWY